jgi:DNA mismatch repair protein MSH2
MVEATIDLAALEEHQFVIKPDFDDNLKNYRKRMDDLRDDMATEHIRVGHDLNQDTEKKLKLEQQHVYGWCLRLTRNVTLREVSTDFRKPDLSEGRRDILYNLVVLL